MISEIEKELLKKIQERAYILQLLADMEISGTRVDDDYWQGRNPVLVLIDDLNKSVKEWREFTTSKETHNGSS